MGDQIHTLLGSHIRLVKGVSYRKIELVPGAGVKLVNLACVKPGGGFLFHGLKDYAGEFRHEQTLLPGDVAVALTDVTQSGSVIGRPIRVPGTTTPSVLVSSLDIAKIILTSEAVLPAWLYYRLQAPDYIGHVTGSATGTTVRHLSPLDVSRFSFALPPLSEQRAIAEVLGALDDKIEANRRVADLATNLALAQATSALEHVGGTPTDLERIADITKGVSYRSDDLIPGDGWLVSLKCVGRDGSFEPGGLKPFSGPVKPGQVVDDGDVLVAQTDLTQRGEVIGRPIRVQRLGLAGRFVASLDFAVVRPRPPLTRELLFGLLSQRVFREHALGFCNGTTVLHMNSRALPSYQVTVPGAEQGRQLTNIMKPLFECSAVARHESSALGRLRDTLLPKLLSGELRVRDAESFVREAV